MISSAFKLLLEAVNSVKKEMKAGQVSIKEEMEAVQGSIEAGQKEIRREITCIMGNKFETVEGWIDTVEDKDGEVQEKASAAVQKIKERISSVQQQIEKQIDDRFPAITKEEMESLKKSITTGDRWMQGRTPGRLCMTDRVLSGTRNYLKNHGPHEILCGLHREFTSAKEEALWQGWTSSFAHMTEHTVKNDTNNSSG